MAVGGNKTLKMFSYMKFAGSYCEKHEVVSCNKSFSAVHIIQYVKHYTGKGMNS